MFLLLDRIVSWLLGFSLMFTGPKDTSFLVTFSGPYRLSLFEIIGITMLFIKIISSGIKINKRESLLFLALFFVLLSLIISLFTAEDVTMMQWAVVLRYAFSTIGIIYVLTSLFGDDKNRRMFLYGLAMGVAIEIAGGLTIFANTRGMERTFFINTGSWQARVFFLIAFTLALLKKNQKMLILTVLFIIFLNLLGTLSRAILIFLSTTAIALIIYSTFKLKRPLMAIATIFFVVLLVFSVTLMLPWTTRHFLMRVEKAIFSPTKDSSTGERLFFAERDFNLFLENPISGIGAGYLRNQFGISTQKTNLPSSRVYEGGTSHSRIIEILAETGIIGFFAYILWVIAIFIVCLRILNIAVGSTWNNIFVTSAALVTLLFIISDIYNEVSFLPYTNAFIAFVLGWLRENTKEHRYKIAYS